MSLALGAECASALGAPAAEKELGDDVFIIVNEAGVFYGCHDCIADLGHRQIGRSPVLANIAESSGHSRIPCTIETFRQWLCFSFEAQAGVAFERASSLAALLKVQARKFGHGRPFLDSAQS
jgi:hypothetical protein